MSARDLIAKLEALDGPDREMDALIARLVGWTPTGHGIPAGGAPAYWYGDAFGLPAYTASIDAAIALVERVLPGWTGLVDFGGTSRCSATLVGPLKETGEDLDGYPVDLHDSAEGVGTTPAIALLIALLRARSALEARQE